MKNLFSMLITLVAFVTMYAATGHVTASGAYPIIGGIACPRSIPLGSTVEINDDTFVCNDRTARRLDGRFDVYSTISESAMLKFGKQKMTVKVFINSPH